MTRLCKDLINKINKMNYFIIYSTSTDFNCITNLLKSIKRLLTVNIFFKLILKVNDCGNNILFIVFAFYRCEKSLRISSNDLMS